MRDTNERTNSLMTDLMRRKSGEERLKMCLSMFDMAKELVLASMKAGDKAVLRRELFRRFYWTDFGPKERDKIERHLS